MATTMRIRQRFGLLSVVMIGGMIGSGCTAMGGDSPDRASDAANRQLDRTGKAKTLLEIEEQKVLAVTRAQSPSDLKTVSVPIAEPSRVPTPVPLDLPKAPVPISTIPTNVQPSIVPIPLTPVTKDGEVPAIAVPLIKSADAKERESSIKVDPIVTVPLELPKSTLDTQVRIVATVGGRPIYDREVREAVFQRLYEINQLPENERKTREKQMYQEELKSILERELILEEMTARLKKNPKNSLKDLEESAEKSANQRIADFRKQRGIPNDEVLSEALAGQGLSIYGIKRSMARGYMMQTYMRSLVEPQMSSINLRHVREFYDGHPELFSTDDKLKWRELHIAAARYPSRAEAKKVAESLLQRARAGEDFQKLIEQYDQGLNIGAGKGLGFGEKPGEIRPVEAEPTLMKMKEGQYELLELEAGFHIMRIDSRVYQGVKPFDEKVQQESRKRLQLLLYDAEFRRVVDTLWRRMTPQINLE